MPILRFSTVFFAPARDVWEAAAHLKGFTSLDPDRAVRVSDGALRSGSRLHWFLHQGFPTIDCETDVRTVTPGRGFLAVRQGGSFGAWTHLRVLETHSRGSLLQDRIAYTAPGGALSSWVDRRYVRESLLELLRQAHRATRSLAACPADKPEGEWEADAASADIAARWLAELRGPCAATGSVGTRPAQRPAH